MRNNNFDILHLLCAMLVIVSHSYALVGLRDSEPLLRLTHMMIASDIGLCGFFTISGYFILNSLMTSKNLFSYLGKRCLRIFPALAVCLVVVIVACSFFYTGDGSYWGQKETYSYIWRNLALYPIQWDIPGLFENNFMSTVNGSLWTLAPQFTLYILIIALFFVRKHRPIVVALSFIALILCLIKNVIFADKFAHTDICYIGVNSFSRFAQFFAAGMLLQVRQYFHSNKARWIIIAVCSILALVLLVIHTYIHTLISISPLVMLCVSVIFIMVGEMFWKPASNLFKRVGDLSYGTYIYAFPIQQMIIASIPCIAPRMLMALTIAVVLPVAFVSWKFIEAPALSLKKYL